jgi:hypothetical protein
LHGLFQSFQGFNSVGRKLSGFAQLHPGMVWLEK